MFPAGFFSTPDPAQKNGLLTGKKETRVNDPLTSINGFLNLHNLLIIKGFTPPPAYKNGFLDNLTGNMWLYIEQVVL